MRGVFYPTTGVVEVRELPDPELVAPTDVIVRVTAAGVCGSDLHIIHGHMFPETGFAMGHEYAGEIVAVGSAVTRFKVGDRVAGPPAPWCGECDRCRRGHRQVCERGGVLGSGQTMGGWGGAQSELLRVPWADQDLVLVPDGVTDVQALASGDILSTGWSGVVKSGVGPGETLLVIGCGPIGLSAIHTAKQLTGAARVIGIDTVPGRLELAEALGADATMLSGPDAGAEVLALTGGIGAESVVDAAGVQATMDLAISSASIGGRIALLGIPSRPLTFDVANSIQLKNLTIWSGLGDVSTQNLMMRALADGIIDPTPIFTHQITIDEAPEMYERMSQADPVVVKVLVRP